MDNYDVFDVVNWILSKEAMSPKKLQKMLYYAYSWVLTLTNDSEDNLSNRLFSDDIQAWVHGPVIVKVYNEYSRFGYFNIPQNKDEIPNFSDDVQDILNQVWDVYGGYSADQLESLTHQETPWINARKGLSPAESGNRKISDKDIFECYVAMAE